MMATRRTRRQLLPWLLGLTLISCGDYLPERPGRPGAPPQEVGPQKAGKADGFDWGSPCRAGSGSFTQHIAKNNVVTVGQIPAGLTGVEIKLSSADDVDIQLFDKDGTKVVQWPDGILKGSGQQSTTYKGVKITWSGYNGDGKNLGHEFIRLEGETTNVFVMKAYGYASGTAKVNYEWAAKPNCNDSGKGTFQKAIKKSAIITVGTIPKGLTNVQIQLTSSVDIDIQLYDATNNKAVVKWPDGLLNSASKESKSYGAITVEWSGYNGDGTGKGNETIRLTGKLDRPFVMKVYGYEAGTARVDYSWGKTTTTTGNRRDLSRYQSKDVFLVMGDDLPSLLMTIPVAVIRSKATTVYPLQLVHRDGKQAWDADAAMGVLEQYGATRVVAVGLPAKLKTTLQSEGYVVKSIGQAGLLSYWSDLGEIVYAGGSTEARYAASFIAAQKNAPLVIANSALDLSKTFAGRTVFTVQATCPASAAGCKNLASTGADLEQALLKIAPALCSKVLLYNPADVTTKPPVSETLTTELGGQKVGDLFKSTSAVAPYLAAARQELLLPVRSVNPASISSALGAQIKQCTTLGHPTRYLTIVASPYAVPLQERVGSTWNALDVQRLGNTDADPFMELAVGRIMGLTLTDASALVTRSLFYSKMSPPARSIITWPKERYYNRIEAEYLDKTLTALGQTTQTVYSANAFNRLDLTKASFFFFFGHGNTTSMSKVLTSQDLAGLSLPPMVVGPVGCNSCDFKSAYDLTQLICLQFIRHGAASFIGATDGVGNGYNDMAMLVEGLRRGDPIGEAYRRSNNLGVMTQHARDKPFRPVDLTAFFVGFVLGDPLLDVKLADSGYKTPTATVSSVGAKKVQIELTLPAETAVDNSIKQGDRVFTGPFGLETMRSRGFAPPFTNKLPKYFEDTLVAVAPFALAAGTTFAALESAEVSIAGGSFSKLTTMPVTYDPYYISFPIEKAVDVQQDKGSGLHYLSLRETLGGDPRWVITKSKIPARTYRITIQVK